MNKIYIGSGKTIEGKYGVSRKITLKMDEAIKHIYEVKGNKYLTLWVNDKRETDQFGKNVAVTVSEKPKPITNAEHNPDREAAQVADDLPF